ncbi:MAG: FecCD family ABC transporter permease [Candidatus Omnitrophota bacterium]
MSATSRKIPLAAVYSWLAGLLIAAFWGALSVGPSTFSIAQAIRDPASDLGLILWDIRLPRAILGALVGATLGLAGASMQGFLRNPLAEPGVLGVSGGAAFGAVLVYYTGWGALFWFSLPLGGILGALLTVFFLYLFSGKLSSAHTLILTGVAVNVLALSGTSLFLNLCKDPYAVLDIVFWQMGSLSDRSFEHVLLALPCIFAGWGLLLWDPRALDALGLGEETAASLGIGLRALRLRTILGTAFCVGASVAICGSIAFVGLVIPHLLRPFVNYEPGKLLGVSAIGGAILLLLSDIAVRLIPTSQELKLGVLTSLIGAPFFILLVFKMRKDLS